MKFNVVYIGDGISKDLLVLLRGSGFVDNVNYLDIGLSSFRGSWAVNFGPEGFLNIKHSPLSYFFNKVMNSALNSDVSISKYKGNDYPFLLLYNTARASVLSEFRNVKKVFIADTAYLKNTYRFGAAISVADFIVNLTGLNHSDFTSLVSSNSTDGFLRVFTPNSFIDNYCFNDSDDFGGKIVVGTNGDLDLATMSSVVRGLPQYEIIEITMDESGSATFSSNVISISSDISYTYFKNCKDLLVTESFFQLQKDLISSLGREIKIIDNSMAFKDIKMCILEGAGIKPEPSELGLSSIEGEKMFKEIICEAY